MILTCESYPMFELFLGGFQGKIEADFQAKAQRKIISIESGPSAGDHVSFATLWALILSFLGTAVLATTSAYW